MGFAVKAKGDISQMRPNLQEMIFTASDKRLNHWLYQETLDYKCPVEMKKEEKHLLDQ